MTKFVEREKEALVFGQQRIVIETAAYPQAIARQNEVTHSQVIEPALELLHAPIFNNANAEYLKALEDHRKGDLSDCLVKCCSALESTIKIICAEKGWPYRETDSAGKLIKTFFEHSNLNSSLEAPMMAVATLRNKLSSAHGAGKEERDISNHIAAYALNTTATCILLLVAEADI